jgi:hypothetical protein
MIIEIIHDFCFKKVFEKTYVTKEEQDKRLSILTNSCQSFLQRNMLAQTGLATYETAINQFSDIVVIFKFE